MLGRICWIPSPTLVLLLCSQADAFATVRYVDANSASSAPPYTNWAAAAKVIQDAVDAAAAGDEIVVTNGVYATGGRPQTGSLLTNRVTVDKPLTVRSVNGPGVTVIQGFQVPSSTNALGDSAVRGVYLTNGAALVGFMVTNGTGGIYCESTYPSYPASLSVVISNCVLVSNVGGGAFGGTLIDCVIATNSANEGGGASYSRLTNCTLAGNSAQSVGGGASASSLNNCTLIGNRAGYKGGGASGCTLNKCIFIGNSAENGGGCDGAYLDGFSQVNVNNCTFMSNSAASYGGGVLWGILSNCTVIGNSAGIDGGGAFGGTLNTCALASNVATNSGGGAYGHAGGPCTLNNCVVTGNSALSGGGGGALGCSLNNCTLTGNSALLDYGGGVADSILSNSIVYLNTGWWDAPDNYYNSSLTHCCTTPLPANGVGNISDVPSFVDLANSVLRLESNSPCINAGRNAYVSSSTDLDGNPRIVSGTVDIGAYEFQGPGSVIAYAWLQHYGLPTDGSADFSDPDADGHSTFQEWRCQTDPTNALSALRLLALSRAGGDVAVSWQSVPGLTYFLERGTNPAVTTSFRIVATNLFGQPGTTTVFTDTNTASAPRQFFRLGIQE